MPLDPTQEEKEIQDIVHELSVDIEKDRNFARQWKRILLLTFIALVSSGFVALISYLLYLNFYVSKLQTEVKQKEKNIQAMEESLYSLMYQEQLREEQFLPVENESDVYFSKQVEENISFLKEASKNKKGRNILRGNEKQKEISLTFDLATGEELSTLLQYIKDYNIKVTLFLSNERPSDTSGSFFIRQNLDIIKKMAKTGRVEFANHTWSHFNYARSVSETSKKKRTVLEYLSKQVLDLPRMAEELKRVEDIFSALTKQELTKYYRLPYGAINQLILDAHASIGYQDHIMWSRNNRGSLDLPDYIHKPFLYKVHAGKKQVIKNPYYKTSQETIEYLESWEASDPKGMNGAIILMHLGGPRKFDKLIYILPEFIGRMQKKGYKFVTLSEVLNEEAD